MRIAFNATPLLSPFTGIGQYTYHLAKGLMNTPEINLDYFYGMGWSKELRDKSVPGIVTVKSFAKRLVPNIYRINRHLQQYMFSRGVKGGSPDLYHEPNFLAFKCNKPTVITVHDLSWIRYPETHPITRVRAMNRYFEPGLKCAASIITDSEFIKQELMQLFGLPSSSIQSISLGVEPMFHPRSAENVSSILNRYNLTYGQYLLTVGTLEPRKNLHVVIQAYQQLSPSIRKRFPLVIVGMMGWNTAELEKTISPLIRSGEIRQIGYLPRHELAEITAGALTMIYLSMYEGFGLPPLEAMACGVPVITSGVSSLPEVVGDTGLTVDPHNIDDVVQAMQVYIDDVDRRMLSSQKALARSAQFTWSKCAAQTVSHYAKVLK